MKAFVAITILGLVAAVCAFPFTDEQKHKGQEHVKKCIAETNVDPAVVRKLKAGDFSNEDESTQCFTLCFFREAGFMDADGNQNEKVIIEKLSTDKDSAQVKAVYEKCKNEKGATPCRTAFNTYKCYRKAVQF